MLKNQTETDYSGQIIRINLGGGAAARGEKTLTAEEARELINRLS